MIAYGITCLFIWVLIIFNVIKYEGETPFGGIAAFTNDSTGNIFIHSGIYGKILVYDKDGNYLRSWHTLGNGSIEMELTKDQNILVTEAKGRQQILYTSYGKEISTCIVDDNYLRTHRQQRIIRSNISEYQSVGVLFYPMIYETRPVKKILVKEKWYLTLFSMGVGFACVFIGAILSIRMKTGSGDPQSLPQSTPLI
jgi:hypothetical protein